MATSSILGGERAPVTPSGRDTEIVEGADIAPDRIEAVGDADDLAVGDLDADVESLAADEDDGSETEPESDDAV